MFSAYRLIIIIVEYKIMITYTVGVKFEYFQCYFIVKIQNTNNKFYYNTSFKRLIAHPFGVVFIKLWKLIFFKSSSRLKIKVRLPHVCRYYYYYYYYFIIAV